MTYRRLQEASTYDKTVMCYREDIYYNRKTVKIGKFHKKNNVHTFPETLLA